MMRVEIENGVVICGTDSDWKNLPDNEHEFLHKCYTFWEGFTKEGKLKWHELYSSRPDTDEWRFRQMISYAESCGVEVSEEVREHYRAIKEKAEEYRIIKERQYFLEAKRRTWEQRERNGCEGCRECARIGDGWFRCRYSGDDLEARFSEVYDPATQCMIIFHEVGIPNAHCKDYYQERKEFGGRHGKV